MLYVKELCQGIEDSGERGPDVLEMQIITLIHLLQQFY